MQRPIAKGRGGSVRAAVAELAHPLVEALHGEGVHAVYSAKSTDERTVIVDGRIRMLDGKIVGLDEKTNIAGAQQASSRILVAAGLPPGAGR